MCHQPNCPIPYGECHCGCRGTTKVATQNNRKYGEVKGQHRRFIKNHHTRKSGVDYIEQDCGYETRCWVWQLALNTVGYAIRHRDGQTRVVHRLNYERDVGPVPEGLELDHLCRVRRCVNPAHLEPVTHTENLRADD
jgi:hypothetical protein